MKEIEIIQKHLDPQKTAQLKELLEALGRKDHINININFININSPSRQPIKQHEAPDEPKLLPQDEELSIKEAVEEFGFSKAFLHQLVAKHPEFITSTEFHQKYVSKNKLQDYFDKNPQHKFRQGCRWGYNLDILVERSRNILKDESKKLACRQHSIPASRRNEYLSYEELAKKLGVSKPFFYAKIRPGLLKTLNGDPQEKTKKEFEDAEWQRLGKSWKRMNERDKEPVKKL